MFENLEILKSHVEKKISSLKEAYLFSDLDKYKTKSYEFLNYTKEYGFKYFETFRDKVLEPVIFGGESTLYQKLFSKFFNLSGIQRLGCSFHCSNEIFAWEDSIACEKI